MSIEPPDFVRVVLTRFENSTGLFREVAIGDALRQGARDKQLSQDERDGFRVESSVFILNPSRGAEPSCWDTYFGPLFSAEREDGTAVHVPDLNEMDEESISYWEGRAEQVRNPIMKARYADAVWDLKAKVVGKKPDVKFARIAIDAYLDAVRRYVAATGSTASEVPRGRAIKTAQYADRALALAVSIADKQRIETAKEQSLRLLETMDSGIGAWVYLFDAQQAIKKGILTAGDKDRLIAALERLLARAVIEGPDFDPFAAQAAAERLTAYYRRKQFAADVVRVNRDYCKAFEALAAKGNAMLAMSYLKTAFEGYRDAGLKDEADAALRTLEERGKDAHKDMKLVSAPISISQEELTKYAAEFVRPDLEDTLNGLVGFGMRKAYLANSLAEIAKEAPLQARIPVVLIQDGREAANVGSLEEDPEGRLMLEMSHLLQGESLLLGFVINSIKERHSLDADKILQFIRKSPVFNEDQLAVLREGIDAYLREDYVKAIHTIIPQMEAALRNLLRFLGVPTTKPSRSGAMQVKNLNDILAEPQVKAVFGEELEFYLRGVLVDQRSLNIRNNVCHGLLRLEQFGRFFSDRVFHALLCVAYIRDYPRQEA